MSAIYFSAAMLLVNARESNGVFYAFTRSPPHRMRYERRCQVFAFIGRKLYAKLGQE